MKSFEFSSNEHTSGCISGILRRILCKNLSRSEQYMDEYEMKQDEKKQLPPSPNLVAKLMGLETMPIHPYTPKESFVRSRSTNSMEGWYGFLSSEMNWGAKPRISQSFREEPTFLRKESDEFLVLSFTPEEKREEFGKLKSGESNVERQIVGKENVRSKNYCKALKKEELNENVQRLRVKQREEPRRPNSKKNKKRKGSVCAVKKVELECYSENSSPVSVLDRRIDIDGEYSPISEEDKKPKQEKPRKKPSSSGIKCESYPSTKNELIKNSKQEGIKSTNAKSNKINISKKKQEDFSDTWGKFCQMAEEELKNSYWDFREIWRLENNGEIAQLFGEEILDFIIYEMVTELSTCFIKK